MTQPTIREHNLETDEIIDREMTEAELEQWQAAKTAEIAKQEAEAQKATEKAALLEKLGITADEAALLLS
jgi:hypothetical protein